MENPDFWAKIRIHPSVRNGEHQAAGEDSQQKKQVWVITEHLFVGFWVSSWVILLLVWLILLSQVGMGTTHGSNWEHVCLVHPLQPTQPPKTSQFPPQAVQNGRFMALYCTALCPRSFKNQLLVLENLVLENENLVLENVIFSKTFLKVQLHCL